MTVVIAFYLYFAVMLTAGAIHILRRGPSRRRSNPPTQE